LQKDVALQVVRLAPVLFQRPLDFLLERRDPRPQQAVEVQAQPLLFGETRCFVKQRVVENLAAAEVDLILFLAGQRIDLYRKEVHRNSPPTESSF